jgi:hypothetical protein
VAVVAVVVVPAAVLAVVAVVAVVVVPAAVVVVVAVAAAALAAAAVPASGGIKIISIIILKGILSLWLLVIVFVHL